MVTGWRETDLTYSTTRKYKPEKSAVTDHLARECVLLGFQLFRAGIEKGPAADGTEQGDVLISFGAYSVVCRPVVAGASEFFIDMGMVKPVDVAIVIFIGDAVDQ